jgi:aspartate ammonia-lyase
VVKEALLTERSIVDVVLEKKLVTKEKLKEVLDLKKLTEPGVHK